MYPLDFIDTKFVPEYKELEVNDGKVAWWLSGDGKNTIVWLHGLPLDSRSWEAQRRHFSPLCRNVFLDLRGYGRSTKLPSGTSGVTRLYSDDLLSLFEALHLDKPMLVGFASAGHIALRFAALYPEQVGQLVCLNASPKFCKSDDWPWGFSKGDIAKFTEAAKQHGIEGITDLVLDPDLVFRDLPRAEAERLNAWFRPMSLNAGTETLLGFFDSISKDDDRQLISRITASTLLISSTIGQEVPGEVGLFLRQQISKARLVELPGVDHFAFATRSHLINELIEDFLQEP